MEGTKQVAERIVTAEERFADWVVESIGCARRDAFKVLAVYRKARAVKVDPITGQFSLTHGGFADADVLRRALAQAA